MVRVGRWQIGKIHDLDLALPIDRLLPDLNNDTRCPAPAGDTTLSVHSWLLVGEGRTILVDAGAGNDKPRADQPLLDHLQTPYLANLAAAGITPPDIDMILLTHVHADHVGWNTRLDGERWVPTFPHAVVVCSDREWRYGAALEARDEHAIAACRNEAGLGESVKTPLAGTFTDSMRPLEQTGRLRRIAVDGSEVLPDIAILPMPGHSIDHVAIMLRSDGQTALFSGDIAHHPVEIEETDLVSSFCEFPAAARTSRRRFLDLAAEKEALVFTSHFTGSSIGRVRRRGSSFVWSDERDAP